jgi:hypothetical protein
MQDIAFRDVLSKEFGGFTSRMWLDYCDENSSFGSTADDYPTYLVNNFKYLIRRFNSERGNEELNIK